MEIRESNESLNPMGCNLEAILFDLDGVLVDTAAVLLKTYQNISGRLGIDPPTETQVKRTIAMSPRKAIDYLFGDSAGSIGSMIDEVLTANMRLAKPFGGVTALLEELRSMGITIGTVTSRNSTHASALLNAADLGRFMDDIVTWGHYRVAKPAPTCIFVALDRIGKKPSDTAYVGDQPEDMKAAKGAGCMAIGVIWSSTTIEELSEAGADVIIEKPKDIITLLT